jgi:hypothetical protein
VPLAPCFAPVKFLGEPNGSVFHRHQSVHKPSREGDTGGSLRKSSVQLNATLPSLSAGVHDFPPARATQRVDPRQHAPVRFEARATPCGLPPSGTRLNHRTKVTFNRIDFDQDVRYPPKPRVPTEEIAGLVERASSSSSFAITPLASPASLPSNPPIMRWPRTRCRKFLCNSRPSSLRWAAAAALRRHAGRGGRKS